MECPPTEEGLPEEVRNVLFNFKVGYFIEKPANPDEYGLRFFEEANAYQVRNVIEVNIDQPSESEDDSDTEFLWQATNVKERRNGVCFQNDVVDRKRSSFEIETNQRIRIKLFLQKLFPFKVLDEPLLNEIIDGMVRVDVLAGNTVVRQGDISQHFFMIESGAYEEWISANGVNSLLFRYESWGCFGLASLIFPHAAQATVIAKKDGTLWALNCSEYRSLVTRHENNILELKRTFLERLPFISKLSRADIEKLVDGIKIVRFKKGCPVVGNATDSNCFYHIRSGRVLIKYKDVNSGNEALSRVAGPGEHSDDLVMFHARLNGTEAVAMENCEILFLSVTCFERLLGPFNRMAFPDDRGTLLLGFGELDDSSKIALYRELNALLGEYRNHGTSKDFVKFGVEHYRRQAEMKNQHGDCDAGSGPASEIICGEWGDRSPEILTIPESKFSVENVTYAIENVHPSDGQLIKIRGILHRIPIFKVLSEMKMEEVIKEMQLVTLYSGHYVIKSGNIGQYFYVIEEGEFRTVLNGEGVTHEILGCPNYFGELGLIMDVPRFADVIAVSGGCLWALSRENFRKVADTCPVRRKGLNYKLVKNVKKLGHLPDYDIKALSLSLHNITIKDREVVHPFQEDSAILYFVKKGTVRVYSKTLKQNHMVARNGQSFGFLVFSMKKCDELRAQSVGVSKIAILKLESFENLLGHCRKVLYQNKCLQSMY